MTGRPARVLVAVALAAPLATAAAAIGSGGDPKEAFTQRDIRWAKRIVVQRADLPTGVKWSGIATGGPGGGGAGAGPKCPGVRTDDSDLTETGRAAAPLFIDSKRQYAVVSAAWIFRSSRDARSFVGRLIEATNRCGSQGVKSEVGATKSERLVSYGVQHIAGTRDWWNYRVVVTLPVQGRRVKSFVDMGLGQRGRAAAWLVLHGAPAPIPADVEASVVQAVLARMTKQPH